MCRIKLGILVSLAIIFGLKAQEGIGPFMEKNDSLSSDEIIFTPKSASSYIVDLLNMKDLWKHGSDSLTMPLSRLIDQYIESFDSVENSLSNRQLYNVRFRKVDMLHNDTLSIRWLNDTTFIIDTMELHREPLILQKTVVKNIIDTFVMAGDYIFAAGLSKDSLKRKRDTIINEEETTIKEIIDSAFLQSKNLQLYEIKNQRIVPGIFSSGSNKSYHFISDGSKLIVSEPVQVIVADHNSPFNIVPNEKLPDSLSAAVQTLLTYIDQRDSMLIFLNNIEGFNSPFWLTQGEDGLHRYWVKNEKNDSVSIWLGNPDKHNITLILEDDIRIVRIDKETFKDVPFTMTTPQDNLAQIEALKEIPVYWDYDFSSSFSLSQNYLSNWSKGGENSLSSILDIKVQAKYTNKEAKREWTNNGRLKYGSIITEENGLRKNTDILELDSKFNKSIKNKIDFSALYHMKNQIAEGKNYPTDTTEVLVSKFMNPTTFTVGAGIEYKPIEKSTINFSVLSYKNTFVLDTVNIDQTLHGIDGDKRSKQEMGGQLLIKNEFTFFDNMKISNSMRLFSNYLEKPENIDVEWEFDLEKQISLYFTVLLNVHLIYDDDIRFPKLDKNDEPILLSDGSEKKIPKTQFKQFLGLTFLIKL